MIDHRTAGPGATAAPAAVWNAVAFAAGERLLKRWVATDEVPGHVVDLWIHALAAVAGEAELRTEEGYLHLGSLQATARPFGLGVRASAHEALLALFTWGTRRAARDRRVHWSLPVVLTRVADAVAELAEVAGGDPAAARAGERAAQDEDIARVTILAPLEDAVRRYQEQRVRAHAIWELHEGSPRTKGASDTAIARLARKFGRPLPTDYEDFLRRHDGWEGYEYDRALLSAKQILDDVASDSVETNMDNMDEDAADQLANVFVIGVDHATATILYYDASGAGEPELVEHYVDELGRWPSLTAYFESLRGHLETALAAESRTRATALADWDPATRAAKAAAYHAELAARWHPPADPPVAPTSFDAAPDVPRDAAQLVSGDLRTWLGFCGYLLHLPTPAEATAAATAFRRHFPWEGVVEACAPSDEYAARQLAPTTTDFGPFLEVQSGGHFGLRLVDLSPGGSAERIFNLRGAAVAGGTPTAPFLEVLVPVQSDPAALRAFVLELADVLPLAHGLAGYFALPSRAHWRDHLATLHRWCSAHWGLELALADELVPLALHGLHGASWLTLLDRPTTALVRAHLPTRDVHVHDRRLASVLEAGDGPSTGDLRTAWPRAVAAVHHALAPLLAPGLGELRHFDDQGGTRAWWQRFEDPSGFAVSAATLLGAIRAAVAAADEARLRAALRALDHRPPELAASLHQPLSELAIEVLRDRRAALAVALYEHLTAGPAPHPANLGNALLAALQLDPEAGREVADGFVARALPSGAANPQIFHDAACIHARRGDLEGALQLLSKGAPHYTVALYTLLDSDDDLAPLRGDARFVKLHRSLRKRLGLTDGWPPLARHAELEAAVGADLESDEAHQRYAAWLTSVGDPRGPLIEAHLAEHRDPRSKEARAALRKLLTPYLRNRLQARHPAFASHFKAEDFRRGLLHRAYFNGWEKRHHAAGLELLRDPECLFLSTVYLHDMELDLAELSARIPYVRELNLTRATFPTLAPLARFAHLQDLCLNHTTVVDLEPLRTVPRLRRLSLDGTAVTDLRPLAGAAELTFLSLQATGVQDLEPLFALPQLTEVWLSKTPAPKAQGERLAALLRARGPGTVYGI